MPDRFDIGDPQYVLDAIIDRSGEMMVIVDLDGRVVRWNPRATEVLRPIAGHDDVRVLPFVPDSLKARLLTDLRAIAAEGAVARRTLELTRGDGTALSVHVTIVPMTDSEGHATGALIVGRDPIATADMYAGVGVLTRAVEALEARLSSAASSLGLLCTESVASDRQRRSRAVQLVQEQLDESRALLSDVRVMAALDRGVLEPGRTRTDLGMLVAGVIEALGSRGGGVALDMDLSLPGVAVDPDLLRRAVDNVIRHVLDMRPVEKRVDVSVLLRGEAVAMEVRAPGKPALTAGPATALEGRWVPHDAGNVPLEVMGLYIASRVVHAHGGTCSVLRGEPGVAVSLSLPVEDGIRGANDE